MQDKATNFVRVEDSEELKQFLTRDSLLAAYQLGDLDPRYAPYCTWFGCRDGEGVLTHLLLLYTGLSEPSVLILGPQEGLEVLLEGVKPCLPNEVYVQVLPEHEALVKKILGAGDLKRMVRMGLQRRTFCLQPETHRVEEITHADTAALMSLYRYYPDHFFEPYQLETGLYFGVWEEGELVAAAGVHVLSERFDIVALGNIVTHPQWRNKGLGGACVNHLLSNAFQTISLAALNTEENNHVAQRAFEKVGFNVHHIFLEGPIQLS